MSTLNVNPYRDAITEAIVLAWSVPKVHYGAPRLPQAVLPYAVLRIAEVTQEQLTVCDVEQTYVFDCIYVGKWTDNVVLEEEKVEKANTLIAALMKGATFGDGMSPLIRLVSFEEYDDDNEPTYEVLVQFELKSHAHLVV